MTPTSWHACPVQSPPLACWGTMRTHFSWTKYYECDEMSLPSLGYKNPVASISLTLSFDRSEKSQWAHCELPSGRALLQGTNGSSQHPASTWAPAGSLEVGPHPAQPGDNGSLVRDPEPQAPSWVAAGFLTHRNYQIVNVCCFVAKLSVNLLHSNR